MNKGKDAKKNQNVNFFQKGGGGQPQSLHLKKSLYTVKRGFNMDFFNTRMCFGKFWEQQKKFWDANFFCWNFCKKVYISRGEGGVNANLENVYI